MGKRPLEKPQIGDLIKIKWHDAGSYTNTLLRDIDPFIAENIGYIQKIDQIYYYLRTGMYISDEEDKRDYDITLIPKCCAIKISIIQETFRTYGEY
jgi:hypothetical protein